MNQYWKSQLLFSMVPKKLLRVHLKAFSIIAGYEYKTNLNDEKYFNEIPAFYHEFGVKEYYILDPNAPLPRLEIFERENDRLLGRDSAEGWVSPLLGIRFVVTDFDITLYYPDGKSFLTFVELGELQKQTQLKLEIERRRAENESLRADNERLRAENESKRAAQFASKLRELGIDPDSV